MFELLVNQDNFIQLDKPCAPFSSVSLYLSFKYWSPIHCGKGLQLNLQRYGFFKGSHCDSAKVTGKGCWLLSWDFSQGCVTSQHCYLADFSGWIRACFRGQLLHWQTNLARSSSLFKMPCVRQPNGKQWILWLSSRKFIHVLGIIVWLLSSSICSECLFFFNCLAQQQVQGIRISSA